MGFLGSSINAPKFEIIDGVLEKYNGTDEHVVIPDGVTKIDAYAFGACSELLRVTMPDSVTSIGKGAFSFCCNLKEVLGGTNLTTIEENAFIYCRALSFIDLPSVLNIGAFAFQHCESLRDICVNRYAVIDKSAFDGDIRIHRESFAERMRKIYNGFIYDEEEDDTLDQSVDSDKYVFISYSTQNQSHAEAMRHMLNEENIRTWMAPYDIPAGSKYAHVINDAIENCSCVLLLLTEQAQSSEWVEREIERAISYRKTVISMHLDECKLNSGFKYYIGSEQIVPIRTIDKNDKNMQKILDAIKSFVR